MRTWTWACALILLLIAEPAMADTWSVDDVSFDVDTRGACVIVPEGHREYPACNGIDERATQHERYAFYAIMPLGRTATYRLGVMRLASPGTLQDTKRALEDTVEHDEHWKAGPASTSTITNTGELQWSTFDFELTLASDSSQVYVESYAVPAMSNAYVVETFVERTKRREASEGAVKVLESWKKGPRPVASSELIAASRTMQHAWYAVAFATVLFLVVRDARDRRERKPQRDRAAMDLPKYESARRLGALAAMTMCGSVLAELFGYAFPSAAVILRAIATLVAFAALAPMLLWVHRIAVNARVLGCANIPTATKAVTWFFVPLASVFMPYRSVADIAASIRGPNRMDAVWRVALWWLPTVSLYAARFFEWRIASTLFAAVGALAAWSMVVAIDQGQARMFREAKKRRKSRPSAQHRSSIATAPSPA